MFTNHKPRGGVCVWGGGKCHANLTSVVISMHAVQITMDPKGKKRDVFVRNGIKWKYKLTKFYVSLWNKFVRPTY